MWPYGNCRSVIYHIGCLISIGVSILSVLVLVVLTEGEASFTLNLFPDGYSIGKPFEVCIVELLQSC